LGGESVLSLGDELGRWTTTMAAIDPELSHGSDRLRVLLEEQQSDTRSTSSLVHGDFRLGNVMFLGTKLTGVVDWEIWSVADPRIDLGWLLLFCDHTYFPGVSRPARGMPSTSEMLAEYARLSGNPIEGVDWFLAFACYKMAAIMGDNLRRHRSGRHVDPYQERLPPTIQNLIQRGLSTLEGGGTRPTG
jgi:streptomycin 6-kinase